MNSENRSLKKNVKNDSLGIKGRGFNFNKMKSSGSSLFILGICLFIVSCNENFEPYSENDRFFFTMYGFLDASADTQWVRVAPVRKEYDMSSEIPDMSVTLEHLESGTAVIMKDSLFQFRQGFNAVNAWSEMEIEPEQSYLLRAENTDGDAASEVTVTLPRDFPSPRLFIERIPEQDPRYFLWIDGVERLADVQSRWYYRLYTPYWEEKRMISLPMKTEAVPEPNGSYTVEMFPDEEMIDIKNQSFALSHPDSEIEFLHHQIYVASGGPQWDEDISLIDDPVYYLPDGFSNVDSGLGYMVGIVSKLVPFESCRNENGELIGCQEEEPFW